MSTREEILAAYIVLLTSVDADVSKFKVSKNGRDWKIDFTAPIDGTLAYQITQEVARIEEEQAKQALLDRHQDEDWRPGMFEDN